MNKIVFSPEELMKELKKAKKKENFNLMKKDFQSYMNDEQILFKLMSERITRRMHDIIFVKPCSSRIGMSFIGMGIEERFGLNFVFNDYYKMKEKYLKKLKGKIIFDDEQLPRKS